MKSNISNCLAHRPNCCPRTFWTGISLLKHVQPSQCTNNDLLKASHVTYKQVRAGFQSHLVPTGFFASLTNQRRCFAWLPLSEKPYKACHFPFHMFCLLRTEEFYYRRKS